MIVKIKDFTQNALSESSGTELRKKILNEFDNNCDCKIILDFDGINLFATMFFNASIGFFLSANRRDIVDNIELINISALGKRTYQHSYENSTVVMSKLANDVMNDTLKDNSEE